MGMPAAGKSTLAADYAARGYQRLNRDERGGSLADLARVLDSELARGAQRVVLDNTYGTRALRAPVVTAAARHEVPVRCVVVETSLEDAQANAVARLLALHGRLLEPAELQRAGMIGPSVQFRYRRAYEPPQLDEGFASVEVVPFARAASAAKQRAVIIELDDLVWRKRPRSVEQLEIVPAARECLATFAAAGYVVAGTTWLTPPALDERLAELLGLAIVVGRCAHPAGPPVCWCRKPLPGLALAIAHAHDVDLARSVHIGRGPADRGFAQRAGMRYADVADGFPRPDE
jgi:phosphoglycolate phosphatase-like HAD superfamily hydrolase